MPSHDTLLLPTLLLTACVGQPPLGSNELALRDGEPSLDDESVVALVSGDVVFCTGTVIAADVVLTAAHCVTAPSPPLDAVLVGSGEAARTIGVAEVQVHPDFDPRVLAADLALVILDGPAGVAPTPLAVEAPAATGAADMRVVGYGATGPEEEAASVSGAVRRRGTARLVGVTETHLVLRPGPSQLCVGDSGGPAFATADGVERLVGVTSSGDLSCAVFGRSTRVDRHVRDFLSPYVDPPRAGGCGGGEGTRPASLWLVGLFGLRGFVRRARRTPTRGPRSARGGGGPSR